MLSTLPAGPRVPAQPRVKVLASVVRSGSRPGGPKVTVLAARAAYERAGVGPEDLSLAGVHDASAPAELMIYEDLGLAKPGESGRLVTEGVTTLGGRLPVNPSGGLLCKGHPVDATGVAQIAGARIALTENGGGWLDGDAAAMAIHIFERVA